MQCGLKLWAVVDRGVPKEDDGYEIDLWVESSSSFPTFLVVIVAVIVVILEIQNNPRQRRQDRCGKTTNNSLVGWWITRIRCRLPRRHKKWQRK